MNRDITEKIRHDFDRLALYDLEQWNHNNHYHQFLLDRLPNKCKNVLDLGCGTGEFSRLLSDYAEKVVAIDLSPNSIELAKQKSTQFDNIDYQVADVRKWKFIPEYYDAIVSIATVHHLSVAELLPKIKASLKPGGVLIVLDLLENSSIKGMLSDLIALPLNWFFNNRQNKNLEIPLEAREAMKEHLRTDSYLNFSQIKKIYTEFLPAPKIRQHLFWRYSVVWCKLIN